MKIIKRIIFIVTSLMILSQIFIISVHSDSDEISIFVNGKRIESELSPVIIEDFTMVPLRELCNALDLEIEWENDSYDPSVINVWIHNHCGTIKLETGNPVIRTKNEQNNGFSIDIDTSPTIINDRIFLPARVIAEAFNYNVEWDGSSKIINISPINSPYEALKRKIITWGKYETDDIWYNRYSISRTKSLNLENERYKTNYIKVSYEFSDSLNAISIDYDCITYYDSDTSNSHIEDVELSLLIFAPDENGTIDYAFNAIFPPDTNTGDYESFGGLYSSERHAFVDLSDNIFTPERQEQVYRLIDYIVNDIDFKDMCIDKNDFGIIVDNEAQKNYRQFISDFITEDGNFK